MRGRNYKPEQDIGKNAAGSAMIFVEERQSICSRTKAAFPDGAEGG